MRNTPGWIFAVCGTIIFVTCVAAFVFLAATGADATEFRTFLNTVLNFAGVILAGTSAVAAGAAAKSAANAEKQTNGELTDRIKSAVIEAQNGGADNGRPTV